MSIPNEALQKLVQEIETQALTAQREINIAKSAIAVKQRDARLVDLTATEVKGLPKETRVYEGVGKMFVLKPLPAVEKRLASEGKNLEGEIESLGKKLHYLETTHRNSREHVEKILSGGRR